jgi:hypothetical protein
MIELPSEIWLRVIQYIPDDMLLSLYSVNHIFFYSAMDVRYRTLDVSLHPETDTMMSLDTIIKLRDASNINRVRRLCISDRYIADNRDESEKHTSHSRLHRILPVLLKLSVKRKKTVARIESDALLLESKQHLLQLSHIDTIEINLGQHHLHLGQTISSTKIKWLVEATGHLSSEVKTLRIQASFSWLQFLATQIATVPQLSSLVELHLEVWESHGVDMSKLPIASCLQSLHRLRNLALVYRYEADMSMQSSNIDYTSLLSSFLKLPSPRLEELRIYALEKEAYQENSPSRPLIQLLLQNQNSLHTVDLCLETYWDMVDHGAASVSASSWLSTSSAITMLPKLKHLNINVVRYCSQGFAALLSFLRNNGSSLETLKIYTRRGVVSSRYHSPFLAYSEVCLLLRVFSDMYVDGVPARQLRRLDIPVKILSTALLDSVITLCPSIKELRVPWSSLGRYEDGKEHDSEMHFRQDLNMKHRAYDHWKKFEYCVPFGKGKDPTWSTTWPVLQRKIKWPAVG